MQVCYKFFLPCHRIFHTLRQAMLPWQYHDITITVTNAKLEKRGREGGRGYSPRQFSSKSKREDSCWQQIPKRRHILKKWTTEKCACNGLHICNWALHRTLWHHHCGRTGDPPRLLQVASQRVWSGGGHCIRPNNLHSSGSGGAQLYDIAVATMLQQPASNDGGCGGQTGSASSWRWQVHVWRKVRP
jgi:hypothetical protein